MNDTLKPYADFLQNLNGKILLGCDGFVDETYEVVEVRRSQSDYTPMQKLRQFGELLVERAEGGVGVELVHKRRCEGGFGINTGRVPALLGLKPFITGLFGSQTIDPAFHEFQDICNLLSLGDPALTIALEFSDGKVLMSNLKAVSNLTWETYKNHFGPEGLKKLFADVDILGLGYWSLMANFDEIFLGFMDQYEALAPPRRMFFDFADIKKKSSESFIKSLDLIRSFNSKMPMTLSLNEHEVIELCSRVGVARPNPAPSEVAATLTVVREKIGFDELVVHTPEFAAASSAAEGEAYAIQNRQKNVIRLAGAGDSFNGGYICASLGDLSLKQRLVVANASTAFFVTHATAPTKEQLLAQIAQASDH
jgi:hypothetical protein